MSLRKKVAAACAGLLTMLVLAIAAFVVRDPLFAWRFATYPRKTPVTTVEWYSPMETIEGAAAASWFDRAEAEGDFEPKAYADSDAFVRERNSIALIVLHRGRLAHEWYAEGYGPESRFNSMSMAKTLQGLVMGAALRDGIVGSLEDPISKYLPEWARDSRGAIRLSHLLTMTSDLNFDDGYENPFSDITSMHGRSDALAIALRAPLGGQPGAHFKYKNVDPQILGEVLERASGKRYAQLVSEKIWRPIQAATASIWLDRDQGHAKSYCCVFATARDWARVGQMMLDRGRAAGAQVLPQQWIADMVRPNGRTEEYGYFTWLADYGAPIGKVWRLEGRGKNRVYIVPDHQLVIMRAGENFKKWDERYLVERLVGAKKQSGI